MIHTIRKLIEGKRVLILGYGREGRSSWQRIREAGGYSHLAIADLNQVSLEKGNDAELICGPGYQACLDDFDVVFKSPGIVLERDIHSYGCEIVSQTELFFRRYARQCIGITGTKGKSTTTTLINHILKETGHDCLLAGNIGIPMFDLLDEIGEETLVVCELSCHQLEYVTCAPHIGMLLNIHEEHLDHYGTMEKYVAAKENIYRPQREGDILFCNVDNLPAPGTHSGSCFSVCDADAHEGEAPAADIRLKGSVIFYGSHAYEIPVERISLIGHHNYVDIAFAYGVCRMYGIDDAAFSAALMSYEPLPHRLQYIGDWNGIRFYDDSISTICETTIQALNSLPDTDAVLIGGMDRGIDYGELISYLSEHPVPYILLMEETGRRIYQEIQKSYPDFNHPERVILVYHLDGAVALAKRLCRPGRCCVMSPAAASYGIFKNFEARGDAFKKLVLESDVYQYVLFDLDGTLTDPKEGITRSVQYALKYFGIEAEPDSLVDFIGPPLAESFKKYYGLEVEDVQTALKKYRERFAETGIFENGVYPGISELLADLKNRGRRLALATSKPQVYAERILENYGLMPYFDVVVGSEMNGKRTDKAEVIEEALRQLDISSAEQKKQVLMVGDRLHDMVGAVKNQVDGLGVYYGYAHEGELEAAGARWILSTVEELAQFFKTH